MHLSTMVMYLITGANFDVKSVPNRLHIQAFRCMVGLGHCSMISKYGPSLFKAVGPVDPSFLAVKKSNCNINIHLTTSLRTPQNRKYM